MILALEFGVPKASIQQVIDRWFKDGQKSFQEFAPYVFFCLKANFLWNLGLTNPELFKPDKNDRKDLEYCYYLPNTQIFSSRDKKHKLLVPSLLRADQSFVDGVELKTDLMRISEQWEKLSKDEKISMNAKRGDAPPENNASIVYRLWQKHYGEIKPSMHKQMTDAMLIDGSLPIEEQVKFTFREFMQKKEREITNGRRLSQTELQELNEIHNGRNPTTMLMFKRRVDRERLRKWYPELTDADLAEKNAEQQSQIWLDPVEYQNLIISN